MIMWLDTASMNIFGISDIALKIPTAIFGILTVLGIYLLASELFDSTAAGAAFGKPGKGTCIGLLAAFFLATSFWHVNFSRLGFRVALMPFFLVFTFYFLARAFRYGKYLWAILAGIFFGLGFYTYTGYRLAVPLLFCVLALWLVSFWHDKLKLTKISLVVLVATFFTALPIGIYFLFNLGDFFGRASETSVFSAPQPLVELAKSLVLHLIMFNFYGDGNWRHNFSGAPELFVPVGLLFLLGIGIAAARAVKFLAARNYGLEFRSYSLLLLWFCFMLLPGILTMEGHSPLVAHTRGNSGGYGFCGDRRGRSLWMDGRSVVQSGRCRDFNPVRAGMRFPGLLPIFHRLGGKPERSGRVHRQFRRHRKLVLKFP